MFYQPHLRNHGLKHDPFKALVAPRPIGWISSRSLEGIANLAPYSFFNAFSQTPPLVAFSSGGMKDSAQNIRDTGEFVCNVITKEFADVMNRTSEPHPHGVSEFEVAGLEMVNSEHVNVPRVKGIAAALECKLVEIKELTDMHGALLDTHLVIGQVISIFIDDRFIEAGMVRTADLHLLARLGYHDYSAVEEVFQLRRPKGGGGYEDNPRG